MCSNLARSCELTLSPDTGSSLSAECFYLRSTFQDLKIVHLSYFFPFFHGLHFFFSLGKTLMVLLLSAFLFESSFYGSENFRFYYFVVLYFSFHFFFRSLRMIPTYSRLIKRLSLCFL